MSKQIEHIDCILKQPDCKLTTGQYVAKMVEENNENGWQMKFHAKMNYKQIQKQTVNDVLEGE